MRHTSNRLSVSDYGKLYGRRIQPSNSVKRVKHINRHVRASKIVLYIIISLCVIIIIAFSKLYTSDLSRRFDVAICEWGWGLSHRYIFVHREDVSLSNEGH